MFNNKSKETLKEEIFASYPDEVWRMIVEIELLSGEVLYLNVDYKKSKYIFMNEIKKVWTAQEYAIRSSELWYPGNIVKIGDKSYPISAIKCWKKTEPVYVGKYQYVLVKDEDKS